MTTSLYTRESDKEPDSYEILRFYAASKLLPYSEHVAGKGSVYIKIGNLLIRLADHENTSVNHRNPDFNIMKRGLREEDLTKIAERLTYPMHCKPKAFAMHVGLTIPGLKKTLPPHCFERMVLHEHYFNTFTTLVRVNESLKQLGLLGFNQRSPVRQESESYEDYAGF
jgi:hypothetical protein